MTDQFDSLDPELRQIVAEARRPVAMGEGARVRLMQAIRSEPAPRRTRLEWVLRPRQIALPPWATAALAAGLVGIGVIGGTLVTDRDGPSAEQPSAVVAGTPQLPDSLVPRTIRFVLVAPAAARVSVVGDFNGWNTSATPMQTQGANGMWTVYVPLQPGLHTYSFVVDGQFVSDPTAPLAPDDGFGSRNSIMLVKASSL
jgi:hypothetical protein